MGWLGAGFFQAELPKVGAMGGFRERPAGNTHWALKKQHLKTLGSCLQKHGAIEKTNILGDA